MRKADFFRYAKAYFVAVAATDATVKFYDAMPTTCRRHDGAADSQKNVAKGVHWRPPAVLFVED